MPHKAFDYIKAANFFPKYAKAVRNWKHKLRGTDGNRKPIDFTEEDKEAIEIGIQKLLKHLTAKKQ